MKATAILDRRIPLAEGRFVQAVVWRVPKPVHGCAHPFKYRLAYVVEETCVLRYDNETGKGDHRHAGGLETHYAFTDLDHLLADFENDIARWNDENRDA